LIASHSNMRSQRIIAHKMFGGQPKNKPAKRRSMTNSITTLTPELETELRLKIAARNKKLAAEKAVQSKNTVGSYLPSDFKKFCLLKAAEGEKIEKRNIYTEDGQGRVWISRNDLEAEYDREALARHGNDPCKRFDEWGFPGTPTERKFLLNHDFGSLVKDSLIALWKGSWVYAHGEVGNGKTALAMRCAWELLKTRPAQKSSFVSMNQYSLDQIQRENSETAAIRRGETVYSESLNFREIVILDDFDKVNYANGHKTRTVLDLVERLKKGSHQVFITSQISLPALYRRYEDNHDMKPLIDRLRQMCLILPEFKEKSKRRFEK